MFKERTRQGPTKGWLSQDRILLRYLFEEYLKTLVVLKLSL